MKAYKINFEENGTLQMCQLKLKNEDVVTLIDYFAYTYSHLVDLVNVLNTQFDDVVIVINYKIVEDE